MPILPELHTVREVAVSRRVLTPPPARTLEDAVRLCDPFTPLDPREDANLHEDLNAIRGGDRLGKIVRNIRRTGGISTLHFVGGHLGCGKTTELLRMRERLELAEQGAPAATVLFLDAETMLDRADVELEDILVASVQADFERALPEAYVSILKEIAQINDFPVSCTEGIKRDLLLNLFVLEYQNGEPEPWYAVHPLVERMRKYKRLG